MRLIVLSSLRVANRNRIDCIGNGTADIEVTERRTAN